MNLMPMRDWLNPPTMFVDHARVNIDDLICSMERPGVIVRCDGNPRDCITLMETSSPEQYAFVAGLISEDE